MNLQGYGGGGVPGIRNGKGLKLRKGALWEFQATLLALEWEKAEIW